MQLFRVTLKSARVLLSRSLIIICVCNGPLAYSS